MPALTELEFWCHSAGRQDLASQDNRGLRAKLVANRQSACRQPSVSIYQMQQQIVHEDAHLENIPHSPLSESPARSAPSAFNVCQLLNCRPATLSRGYNRDWTQWKSEARKRGLDPLRLCLLQVVHGADLLLPVVEHSAKQQRIVMHKKRSQQHCPIGSRELGSIFMIRSI